MILSGENDKRVYINSQHVSLVSENGRAKPGSVDIYIDNGLVFNFDVPFDDVLQKMDKDFKSMAMLASMYQPGHVKH